MVDPKPNEVTNGGPVMYPARSLNAIQISHLYGTAKLASIDNNHKSINSGMLDLAHD